MTTSAIREQPQPDGDTSTAGIICSNLTKIYTGAPPMPAGGRWGGGGGGHSRQLKELSVSRSRR